MANVQLENGFTRIANEILESIIKLPLNGTQLRIIVVIWRNTYGFGRKEHAISESYIAKATGLSKRFISQELKKLVEMNIIKVVKNSTYTTPKTLAFNKDFEKWGYGTMLPQVNSTSTAEQKQDTTEEQLFHTTVEQPFHQQRNIIKKEIKKDICPFLKIIELFNDTCISLSKVQKLTDSRKRKLTARWNDMPDIEQWKQLFNEIEKIPFLKGENNRGWKASFDWLIENDSNITKVLEGQYKSETSKKEEKQVWGWGGHDK